MDQWLALPTASVTMFAVNMLLGLVLSLLVAWFYAYYGEALANRRKLARLLPVLTITTGLVISIVKTSLALSLGLVGALSIVRFRTAIKEPEELMYLFVAIAIGLGMGAEQRWITVVGVFLLLGYMSARLVLSQKRQFNNLYLNILLEERGRIPEGDALGERGDALFSRVNACLLKHTDIVDFRRLDSRDGTLQLTYFVDVKDPETLSQLVDDLKASFPVTEVSFLQQEQVLGG
ncbi:MAG: DUF4956 domain-containing protein [Anaerolineae bacterium]